MRIGFFAGRYIGGGSMRSIIEPLAQTLHERGHQTFVFEPAKWKAEEICEDSVIVRRESVLAGLYRNPMLGSELISEKLRRSGIGQVFSLPKRSAPLSAYDRLLGRMLLAFAVDYKLDVLYLFHNFNFAGLLAHPIPSDLFIMVNFVGFGISPNRGGGWDTFPYQQFIFEHSKWQLQIAATEFEYNQYRKIYESIGLPTERLIYLPHGYEEHLFYPLPSDQRTELRSKYAIPEEDSVLLYPVQVYPRKNIELAIEIAASVQQERPIRLIITGSIYDDDYHQRLLKRAADLGMQQRIQFFGGVARERLTEIFNLADVTIFPSHSETFGHGIVESLGCGTPVVGPAYLQACNDILHGAAGGWVAQKRADDFCWQVLQALRDSSSREAIAAEAQRRYGCKAVSQRWLTKVDAMMVRRRAAQTYLNNVDWEMLYEDDLNLAKAEFHKREVLAQ